MKSRNPKLRNIRLQSVVPIFSEPSVWAYDAILFNYMSTYCFSNRMPASGHNMYVVHLLSSQSIFCVILVVWSTLFTACYSNPAQKTDITFCTDFSMILFCIAFHKSSHTHLLILSVVLPQFWWTSGGRICRKRYYCLRLLALVHLMVDWHCLAISIFWLVLFDLYYDISSCPTFTASLTYA